MPGRKDHGAWHTGLLYLEFGSDRAGRYANYVRLLAEELRRPALSLATEYFAGRGRFVRRMAQRFGLAGPGAYTRKLDWGGDVVSLGPRIGGSPADR